MTRSTFFGIVWLIVVMNGRSFGVVTATKVADQTFTATPNSEISFHTVTQPVDLDRTNWIAWNEFATLTAADPSQPNTLLLGKPSIGVNDFLRLTVTNPTGNALTLDIDQNDGGANSFGPQAVIFGQADTAPDVFRFNELNGQSFLFDEGGSHNSIFTDSGNYQFDFSFRNNSGTGAQNGTWLLTDIDPVLALHQGSNDPVTEGWNRERAFSGVATFPIIDDIGTGFDAWAVDDNGVDGLYVTDLTQEQVNLAMERGWKLSSKLRVADAPTSFGIVTTGFTTDSQGFSFSVGADDDGSPLIQSAGGVIDLDNLDNGYHLYELIFNSTNEEAELFVDGSSILTGIKGGSAGEMNKEVFFGSSSADFLGQGNYNLVSFEIVPEPSAGLLAIFGILGLFALRCRHR